MNWSFPYPSQRMPVFARNVVATSQPLAAQAGLAMLQRGGNAVDAAIATAICLTVVEPCSNGMGSDAFAIVWDGERLHGLNGSGRSPAGWTLDRFKGKSEMPVLGWDAVTVPGCVDVWATLSKRFGKLPFEDLFEPAIRYASDGFLVSPITAWRASAERFTDFPEWQATFAPLGRAPGVGELFRSPNHAKTLHEIARTRGESFYRGEIAHRIVENAREAGGAMSLDDLSTHRSDWVDPIAQEYRGLQLHEIPPNGQGLAALIALGVLRHFDLSSHPVDSADSLHLQIEAMKVGVAEVARHLADPAYMTVTPAQLLDESYLKSKAHDIRRDRAAKRQVEALPSSDTVYLTSADASGMMVSFIQSNYRGFGSGIVIPGTGIAMQNRGHGFCLAPGHPNCVGPRKRPYHTIIPAFVTRDAQPLMSFGVMGGHHQPQGHVQMMVRMFDYHQNAQAAIDAPRWHVWKDFSIALENGISEHVRRELALRGHRLHDELHESTYFGGAQAILKLDDGYCAASEPRKDGQAVGF
jgi:gamma-glutamyltranspeptidase/glutathione hydrolase